MKSGVERRAVERLFMACCLGGGVKTLYNFTLARVGSPGDFWRSTGVESRG